MGLLVEVKMNRPGPYGKERLPVGEVSEMVIISSPAVEVVEKIRGPTAAVAPMEPLRFESCATNEMTQLLS